MRRKHIRNNFGFTLTELLVSSAISILLVGIVLGSLIYFQGMSNRTDRKIVQQANLKRALDLIASDVREGINIKLSETPDEPGFQPIFNLQKPDRSIVAFYSKPTLGGNDWQAPRTIYRRQLPPPGLTEPKDDEPLALLDAIAEENPLNCPAFGEEAIASDPSVGLKIFVPKPPNTASKVLICMRVMQPRSSDGLEASAFITPRAQSAF
jgi:type II secretory pathway pseudopilin PulG